MKLSLKAKNSPIIVLFLVWCCAIYILFLVGYKNFWKEFSALFTELNEKNGIFLTLSPLLCFILTGLLSAKIKAILVFWRLSNPLPGSRAFTKLAPKDCRIDINDLKWRIGGFPQEPETQNSHWYKLYRQVDDRLTVTSAHQSFLLARDLASISFLFLILTPWPIYFYNQGSIKVLGMYIGIFFALYVILCLVAQNHANRFVCNVLVEYCSNKESAKV
jgi:hypothetical protein